MKEFFFFKILVWNSKGAEEEQDKVFPVCSEVVYANRYHEVVV